LINSDARRRGILPFLESLPSEPNRDRGFDPETEPRINRRGSFLVLSIFHHGLIWGKSEIADSS
jgi:hypothetical protein